MGVLSLQSENGADSVYSLQFTSRRSDCTAGSSKPWTDCDYLAVDRVIVTPYSCLWRKYNIIIPTLVNVKVMYSVFASRSQFHAMPQSTWQRPKQTPDRWTVCSVSIWFEIELNVFNSYDTRRISRIICKCSETSFFREWLHIWLSGRVRREDWYHCHVSLIDTKLEEPGGS